MNIPDNVALGDLALLFFLHGITLMVICGFVGFYICTAYLVKDPIRTPIAREYLGREFQLVPWWLLAIIALFSLVFYGQFQKLFAGQEEWVTVMYCLYYPLVLALLVTSFGHCRGLLDKREELIKISLLPMFVGRIAKTEVLNAMSRSLRLTLQKINGEELVVVARESDKGHTGHTLDWVSGETVAVFYDTEEPKLNIAKRIVRVQPEASKVSPATAETAKA